MDTAMNRLEKISHLIDELRNEIQAFPRHEKELNHKLLLKNKESTDIIHIIENVELAPYEAIRVTERLHHVRKERRKLKEQLTAITPLQQELTSLLPVLKQKLDVCQKQEAYHQRDTAYQFRTAEGFQLLTSFVPGYNERSLIPLNSPDNFIPMNPKIHSPIQESVVSVKEPGNIPDVEEIMKKDDPTKNVGYSLSVQPGKSGNPIVKYVKKPSYKIVLNNQQWHIHSDSDVLFISKNFTEVVDKFYELGLESAGTNPKSRHVLLWNLKELKRKNPSMECAERCNHLIKMIQHK